MIEGRPIRSCSGCGKSDDLPRHVIGVVNRAKGMNPETWHWQCHASSGCGVCADQLRSSGGRSGDELIQWLTESREVSNG